MAAPGSSMADIQRRAVENPEMGYRAFDSYPWQKDRVFITQLSEALSTIAPDGSSLSEAALQARIARFQQQTSIQVNAEAYKQWLSQNNQKQPSLVSQQTITVEAMTTPDPKDRKLAHLLVELGDPLGQAALQQQPSASGPAGPPAAADPTVPSWQSAAPTAELYVRRDANPSDPDKEPYPKKFEEIIEFLQTGKEIPGIRKIPDTVIEDPSITTRGRLAAPPKPWEKRAAAAESEDATPSAEVGNT
ncbi:hypothetical protein F4775DRAFT_566454 [Biscogniauxia sp. FL1348]|nr:hypothetical protein F4775DRAFT_566454 [Biscogniauxia sp. FL1348]